MRLFSSVNNPASTQVCLCGHGQDVLSEPVQIIEEVDKGNGEKLSSLALNFWKLARDLRQK